MLDTLADWTLYFLTPWVLLTPLVKYSPRVLPRISLPHDARSGARFTGGLLVVVLSHVGLAALMLLLVGTLSNGASADYGAMLHRLMIQDGYVLLDALIFVLLAALAARIPPMLLQPLFENATVHGLADKEGECRLAFECRLYDRWLHILIFDNGDGFDATQPAAPPGGIGLANVQARLREAYGDHNSLQIEKKPDGTLVTLKMPAYKDSQF